MRAVTLLFAALFSAIGPSGDAAMAETAVSTPHLTEAVGFQSAISVASDGQGYLGAWHDGRSILFHADVRASQIEEGRLVTPVGTRVSSRNDFAPTLLWAGNHYLLFWTKQLRALHAIRVDSRGRPLDEESSVLLTGAFNSTGVIAARSNTRTLVSAREYQGDIALVDDQLRVTHRFPWTTSGMMPFPAAVASDGEDFIVVAVDRTLYVKHHQVLAARISPRDGTMSAPILAAAGSEDVRSLALVWSGRDYILTWLDGNRGLFSQRLNRAGMPVGAEFRVSQHPAARGGIASSAGDGSVVVLWGIPQPALHEHLDVFSTRVGPANEITTETLLASPAAAASFSIASNRNGFLFCWDARQGTRSGIDCAVLDTNGQRVDGASRVARSEQTRAAPAQRDFAADRNLPSEIVAWEEQDGKGIPYIMAARPGLEPVRLAESPFSQRRPSVARGGRESLVVWVEERLGQFQPATLVARRVSQDGLPLDGITIEIGNARALRSEDTYLGTRHAAVTWNGSEYVIAFVDPQSNLQTVRMTAAGRPNGSLSPIAAAVRRGQSNPAFTRIAGSLFLIWQEGDLPHTCVTLCTFEPALIAATRIGADGRALDPTAITISDGDGYDLLPSVAGDGVIALIVWWADQRVLAKRITREGKALDPLPLDLGTARTATAPSVAFDGSQFVVAWEDAAGFDFGDIVVAHVSPDGAHTPPFIAPSATRDQKSPVVWRSPSGETMLAYQRFNLSAETASVARLVYAPLPPVLGRRRAVRSAHETGGNSGIAATRGAEDPYSSTGCP